MVCLISCMLSGGMMVSVFKDFIILAAAPFFGAMASIGIREAEY